MTDDDDELREYVAELLAGAPPLNELQLEIVGGVLRDAAALDEATA